MSSRVIQVASRDEIIEKIGHSPDRATAVILALFRTPKVRDFNRIGRPRGSFEHDPYATLHRRDDPPRDHDPYATG